MSRGANLGSEAGALVVVLLPDWDSPSPMGVPKPAFTRLKLGFVGGSGAGKTSLIGVMTKGSFPGPFQPYLYDPHAIDVEFDPSSYQPTCRGLTEVHESQTRHRIDGMEAKRHAFKLEIYDTISLEEYYPLSVLDSAVIALCVSVVERETFDMIKTRVRRVWPTWPTCSFFMVRF